MKISKEFFAFVKAIDAKLQPEGVYDELIVTFKLHRWMEYLCA